MFCISQKARSLVVYCVVFSWVSGGGGIYGLKSGTGEKNLA